MGIAKRYIVTLLAFIGTFLIFAIRSNLSMALPEMTSIKNISLGNETVIRDAQFAWNSVEIGFILSSFSFGSVFSVLGGIIIPRVGGVVIYGVCTLITAILTLISPYLIHLNLLAFIVSRAILGCAEGLALISLTDIFSHWSPPKERARLIALAHSGGIWSIAINFPLSGIIISYFDWETIFYLSGSLTIVWCFVWLGFVSNRPATDRFISEEEKLYLTTEIDYVSHCEKKHQVKVPWKSIITSAPVYAILNELFVSSFISSFLSACLPLYVNDVFHVDIQTVGFISGVPVLCGCIILPVAAFVADKLRSKVYNASKVNRIYISIGGIGSLIFLFITTLWGNLYGCMLCFCFITMAYSVADSSYQVISIDMAGQYAGSLKALLNVTISAAYFLNPMIVGFLTPNHVQYEWDIYFGFLAVITVYGVIMFFKFGSSDLQPWAKTKREKKNIVEGEDNLAWKEEDLEADAI